MVTSTPGEFLLNKTFIIKLHHILCLRVFSRDWNFHYSLSEVDNEKVEDVHFMINRK